MIFLDGSNNVSDETAAAAPKEKRERKRAI
jgi:hypothetical protein